ncbi:MAG: SDR family oxidoreductase [Acidobacteriaceae bacterium]|nr:SDR family oxidoreductase [Acidobacteriaceae bacterium]
MLKTREQFVPDERRVVIVTGGAYGIGRAIVSRFADAGDAVVIADIDGERGQQAQQNVAGAVFKQTDVRSEEQLAELIEFTVQRFGGIDVLCNNAGIERYRRADEYTSAEWSAIVNTNFRGAFLGTKYAFPYLRKRKGCVVFISSVQAFASEKNIAVYAGTKAGLLGLMRGMALDFAPAGVRVNAVCPGATLTGMMEAALKSETDPEGALQSVAAKIPLGRIGMPEDIAHAVYFLASPQASYITGAHLTVDGGLLAGLAL